MVTSRSVAALPQVEDRIAEAARRAGREPSEVRLVAVTKGHPLDVVEDAIAAGIQDLAENRVEALLHRVERYADASVRWHMVGHLQRRKAPQVRGQVHLLHSLDSLKLARQLERTAGEDEPLLSVLAQVNTSGEESKGGFEPEALVESVGEILECTSLRLHGLMTMAPLTDDEALLRATFGRLRALRDQLDRELPDYDGPELSMGMSNDYEIAIEEGSTMVRLGTALFGERNG